MTIYSSEISTKLRNVSSTSRAIMSFSPCWYSDQTFSKNIPVGHFVLVTWLSLLPIAAGFPPWVVKQSSHCHPSSDIPDSPQCPGCRHQGNMPVVIANDNGSTRQCMGEYPPNLNPTDASFCTVCREDGLRWQRGKQLWGHFSDNEERSHMGAAMCHCS